jgi:hypothetical protein
MYGFLLTAHSLNRWLVIAAALRALVRVWRGRLRGTPWTAADRRAGLVFTTLMNVQVLVGIGLYVASPLPGMLWSDYAGMVRVTGVRFFGLDHPLAMLVAAVVAQVGYSRAKRVPDDAARFRRAANAYTFAVLLVLASVPWPFLRWGRPLLHAG